MGSGVAAQLPTSVFEMGTGVTPSLNKKAPALAEAFGVRRKCGLPEEKSGQCSTLPLRHQSSTIDAEGLNFRVRDGNGCDPFAMATQKNLTNNC